MTKKNYYLLRKKDAENSFGFQCYCSNNHEADNNIDAAAQRVTEAILNYITEDKLEDLIEPLTDEETESMTMDMIETEKLIRREVAVKSLKNEVRETEEYKQALAHQKEVERESAPFLFFTLLHDDSLESEGECDYAEDFYISVSEADGQRARVFQYFDDNEIEYDPTDFYIAERSITDGGEFDIKTLTEAEVSALMAKEEEERMAFLAQQRKTSEDNRTPKIGKARAIRRV